MKKISYKKIKKRNLGQFYELMRALYPTLRFSAVNKKGKVSIRDIGIIPFFRKVNKVDILTILLAYIPTALAIKYHGNTIDSNGNNLANYYRRKAEKVLESYIGSEIDNISTVITLFYNECFDRDANIKKDIIEEHVIAVMNTDIQEEIDEEEIVIKGTANLMEYLWLIPTKKRIKKRAKNLILAFSLSGLLTISRLPYLWGLFTSTDIYNSLCLQLPPVNIIMYNST